MAKKGDKRKLVGLVSEETGHRTYYTKKNVQNTPDKLELRKYDPIARSMYYMSRPRKTSVETKSSLAKSNQT